MLVPVLLGLKGNLEMTLASRLSTLVCLPLLLHSFLQSNLGWMETWTQKRRVFISNIALIQCQAIVVASIAVALTLGAQLMKGEKLSASGALGLLLTSVATASLASYVLGMLMFSVVLLCRHLTLNPDNIMTPVAASVGDAITLLFMIGLGTVIYTLKDVHVEVLLALLLTFLLSGLVGAFVASRDQFTNEVLKHGWWAVLTAMLISCGGGFVFRLAVAHFPSIAVLQPLVNGVGGNLVAVQASRIGTCLHRSRKKGQVDGRSLRRFLSAWRAFCSNDDDSIAARLLLAISVPGHLVFLSVVFLLTSELSPSIPFISGYIFVSVFQVALLLYVCQLLVRTLWRLRVDPDHSAIPCLTALGDLLGTVLLSLAFLVLSSVFKLPLMRTPLPQHNNSTVLF